MADDYERNALEAERLASLAQTEEERQEHLKVAAIWHELAERRAKKRPPDGQS